MIIFVTKISVRNNLMQERSIWSRASEVSVGGETEQLTSADQETGRGVLAVRFTSSELPFIQS